MNKKSRLDKTNNKSEQNTLVSPQIKHEGSAYAEGLSGQKNKASEQETKSLINLPKGGGAIQGIGEKFEANPVNGTFSMSVPIAISPGRAGFSPQLALSYNSGSGNSAFGLGWNIGIPNITRKTDKGLPRYNDSDNTLPSESDTFILSGAEDLIPLQESPRTENDYRIKRYIPRTEGLFARIEQWKNTKTGYIYWRTISKENIVSIYGQTTEATIHHPSDTNKIFTWYLQYSFDARGNSMHYIYKKEDGANVISEPYEFNRIKSQKSFNKIYLSKVCYGNTKMCDEQGNLPNDNNWLFTLAFDYGEYPKDINYSQKLDTTKAWDLRTDPFSSYKAGFEIRTYRLCKRVLMFHKFDELGNTEKLVKATCFNYTNHTHLTLLNKVTHQSFSNGSADNMPPVEFSYSQAKVGTKLHKVNPDQLSNIPAGVDGSKWQFTDLYGEGLNGLLHTENQAWYYKPNLGDKAIYTDGADSNNPDLQLGNIQLLKQKPSLADKNGGNFYLGDVDSDSQPELVFQSEGINGYYSLENGEWQNFTPFAQMPNINISDLNVKNIDLTGNGLSDILISRGSYFEMYFSEGKKGYKEYRKVYTADTEEQGPVVLFSDVKQSIFLADMVGDGLSDIVRITHNSVCYWPNMGYGHFGEKVLMKNPPIFDSPDIFNSSYIKLSDVDGTGTTDILYLGNPLRYYKNQAGNSWSKAHTIDIFPATDSMSQIHITDLLGNGTQCLVWSSPLPAHEHNMCFVELTSGIKPYLLSRFKNNMGRKVDLSYAPSTKFYLQDKIAGKNWITRLPFPVQVLEKVEDYEQVSNLRLVNKYAYHHGYYDTAEREFRGFAMVEQWDTEHLNLGNTDNEGYQPPVYTKKWFHTGFYKDRKNISSQFAKEYFKGDSDAWLLPDTVLPQNLTAQEEREACRALRGQLLRSETYASDGSKLQNTPYLVEEKNFTINRIQAKANNKHASFLVSDNEAISYHYERNIADPRILHTLALEIDAYGNVLKSAQVSYPRRITSEAKSEQLALKIVVSQNDVINKLEKNINLIGIPYQAQSFELKGLNFKWGSSNKLTVHDINQACQKAQNNTSGFVLECFQHQQTTYYNTELTAALNLGEIVAHALPYQNFTADLTDSMLAELKKKSVPVNKNLLIDEAKYIYRDAIYWIPSERQEFDKNKFFQPVKAIDPIGNITSITYDKYNLFITQTTNALNQTTLAKSNYRVLQTQKITDANNNTQELSFDTLGMIKAQALKGSNAEGDTLDLPTVKYSYDLNQWIKFKKPVYVKVEMRETHADANSAWLTSYVYTGGHGNEVMTKAQAENGEVNGKACTNRWVGTGRTILNNKGNVIKQYEPYFSDTHEYESETAITQNGVSPIFYYDPIGRNIKTDFPDGTFTKVEFTPWLQKNYDQNDTVLESKWYIDKGKPGVSDLEPVDALKRAAWLAAQHANTPQVKHFDNLGREFQTDDNNGKDSDNNDIIYSVHNTLDIAGRPIKVTDAKGREMTKIQMGMQQSFAVYNIDSGNRYNLSDVMGKPLYTWDNRNHKIKYTYDQLNRPLQLTLISNNKTYVIEKTIYGSSAQQNNIGQIEKQYDQSGLTLFSYDFKGNVIQTQKQFCVQYKHYRNWDTVENEPLNKETFTHAFSFDALNRPLSKTLPDSTSETYTYNKAGLLETVTNNSKQYVTDINYNAKGQRTSIKYGNNTTTYYQYCRFTFRLTRLYTRRNANNDLMQDLNYIYDPVGNIVEQFDDAQQKHYFSNTVIEPKGTYQYDALYRLIKATGRELKNLQMPSSNDFANDIAVPNTASNAMQKYSRQYTYDQLGNIIKLVNKNTWTRNYFYNFDKNNYLLGHTENTTDYTYDTHGNMLKMPHLQALHWDFKDQLQMVELNSDGNKAYYIYDTQGNRTRKVVKKGNVLEERFYLGDYELYRKTTNNKVDFERKTIHVSDDNKKIALIETRITGSSTSSSLSGAEGKPTIRYQYDNHLGSASLELDTQGQIISYEEYHPFGTTSYRSGRNQTEVSQKRYKYVGKERDEETGLYYYGARYYDANIARWTSVDPLAEKYLQWSPYNYCANNPIKYIDPNGMEIKDPDDVVENYKNHLTTLQATLNKMMSSGLLSAEVGGKFSKFISSSLKEIKGLEKSKQVYTVTAGSGNAGGVSYNLETEEVRVNVDAGNVGLVGHELKHASQFEKGEVSLVVDNSDYGVLYDVSDETVAYNQERALATGILFFQNPSSVVGGYPLKMNNNDVLKFGKGMVPPAYQTLPNGPININSKQGKALRKATIEAGRAGQAVKEVYNGWKKDYAKGAKK